MHTNRGTGTETNVPRTSLPCPPRYGNSTRRWFAKALGANHLLVYYHSGGGSTGLRQVRLPLLSHTILTRETGTRIHLDWQQRILLGMVEALSVNVKNTTTTTICETYRCIYMYMYIICTTQTQTHHYEKEMGRRTGLFNLVHKVHTQTNARTQAFYTIIRYEFLSS